MCLVVEICPVAPIYFCLKSDSREASAQENPMIAFQSGAPDDLIYLDMKDANQITGRISPSATLSWLKRQNAPLMGISRENYIRRSDLLEILKRASVR